LLEAGEVVGIGAGSFRATRGRVVGAGRAEIDVAVDVVGETAQLQAHPSALHPNRQVGVDGRLVLEVGIAHVVLDRPFVYAVGEQLDRLRGAVAPTDVQHQRHRLRDVEQRTDVAYHRVV